MKPTYHIYPLGESAVTIAFEAIISEPINNLVIALYKHLQVQPISGVKDVIPAYHTLTLVFDSSLLKQATDVFEWMRRLADITIASSNWQQTIEHEVIEIPVCYDTAFGLDIVAMAADKSISIDNLIQRHIARQYRIYCIGFLPGFAYMGNVDDVLATPRKQAPRATVKAGSVGIAGVQTGVYPLQSPAGWNIIGETPLQLFDANKLEPVLLKMGNMVQFKPISLSDFLLEKNKPVIAKALPVATANSITIIKQGIADTVQDLGRFGYQQFGINPTGAMDVVAAKVANFLVGNAATEAVFELHFPASVFQFNIDALIALSGVDFSATINDEPIPINTPIIVAANGILKFTKLVSGARCYLAVNGGLNIEKWLGSYSTHLKANAGGYCGRLLQKGDVININNNLPLKAHLQEKSLAILQWQADVVALYKDANCIEIIAGNEYPILTEASTDVLTASSFVITAKSDRMGYQLHGIPLQLKQQLSLISTAVTRGTVQLLPNGELIVLMADHQTIGGYPRVAQVAQVAMPKLAQLQAHQRISFTIVSQQQAVDLWQLQQQYLLRIQNACIFKLKEFLAT
ncbi:MAG: 5-oxoprolinase subunit PxpB [Flavobacterium sp.]|nr:5-oxoprolinase subunit PxpB [Flavobacterium sp.]